MLSQEKKVDPKQLLDGELPETLKCPICKTRGMRRHLEIRDFETHELFYAYQCMNQDCGVFQTLPVPDDLGPYYSRELGDIMRTRGGVIYEKLKRILLGRELSRMNAAPKGALVVDVGAGSGDFTRMLHEGGWRTAAVDAEGSPRPQEIRALPQIPFGSIDYADYTIKGLPDLAGGVVFCRHVLEHVKDPLYFLDRLREQGIQGFYISVPNSDTFDRKLFGKYWFMWEPPRHLWQFNQKSLGIVLKNAGLEVVKTGYDLSPIVVPSIHRYLRLKRAPGWLCKFFGPKSTLCSLLGVINIFFPRNMIWVYARVRSDKSL